MAEFPTTPPAVGSVPDPSPRSRQTPRIPAIRAVVWPNRRFTFNTTGGYPNTPPRFIGYPLGVYRRVIKLWILAGLAARLRHYGGLHNFPALFLRRQ